MTQNRNSFLVVIFLSLHFSTFSNAQVGSIEEAIQSAKDDQEPAYIKDLMEQLAQKLHGMTIDKSIHSPRDRLAWLLTMRSIVRAAWNTVRNATERAAGNAALATLWGSAWYTATMAGDSAPIAAWNIWYSEQIEESLKDAETIAFQLADDAYRHALQGGATLQQAEDIAYRVAEWAVLNNVLVNANTIIEPTYQAALNSLPQNPMNNPFDTHEDWISFYNLHFAVLSSSAMIFLAPWLVNILPMNWVPDAHQPLFSPLIRVLSNWPSLSLFLVGSRDDNNLISQLPTDVACLIMMLAVQAQFGHIEKGRL